MFVHQGGCTIRVLVEYPRNWGIVVRKTLIVIMVMICYPQNAKESASVTKDTTIETITIADCKGMKVF